MGKSHGETPEQQRPCPNGPPTGEDAGAPPGGERRYRANPDFIVRKIAGEVLVVPTGKTAYKFNALITLTEGGAFLLERMKQTPRTKADLIGLLENEYDVTAETAAEDVSSFLEKALASGVVS